MEGDSAGGSAKQYAGLQALNEAYAAKGLAVLGFPCNDFGAQEPGTLGVVGLLDVEDLAPQRQDRLEATVAPLLGGATSGVALHDVDLGFAGVAGAAVGQFSGQG